MKNDVIVVGAGPSGVSCALWLKQLGFSPVVVDRNDRCGGLQLLNAYTNTWIATSANVHGKDVAQAMHDNMVRHGVDMRLGVDAMEASRAGNGWGVRLSTGEILSGRFLVLAAGVAPKTGGFAHRLGMILGPGHGVANTNFSGSKVAILGGGDSAFENYVFAKQRGATSVTIYARTLRARAEMLEQANPEDVHVGVCDVDDVARTVDGVPFDHIIVLYGYEAKKSSMLGLPLGMRRDGFVVTDANCQTTIDSVFAVGEIAQRAHPCCATAMADGVVAAKEIQRRLESDFASKFAGLARRTVSLAAKALA